MCKNIKLSKSDRVIMEILWANGEMTNTEIVKLLEEDNWSRHTVRVYLLRLVDKKLVGINPEKVKRHKYYPLVSRDDFIANETSAYVHDRYNGLAHMVAGLAVRNKVTDDELDKLEQFLKEYRNKEL